MSTPLGLPPTPWDDPDRFPPPVVNESGVRFWPDQEFTQRARAMDLLHLRVLFVEHPDGTRTRMLLRADQTVLGTYQTLEALVVRLEIEKFRRDTAD